MPTIGSHTISVVVNGHSLHEYEPPTDETPEPSGTKKTVYIEVAEGMKFGIHFTSRGPLRFPTGHLGVFVYLDDIHGAKGRLSRRHYREDDGKTFIFKRLCSLEGHTWVERDFQFNSLTTTDAEFSFVDLKKFAQSAGTIRVELSDITASVKGPHIASRDFQIQATPEKALKGQPIDMAAGFGPARPTQHRINQSNSRRVGCPLLQCTFKYRSRKALQMLDIIPATPEPLALHERDPNTLSLAEARELLSQMQTQGRRMDVIKEEDSSIKQEQDSKAGLEVSSSRKTKRGASLITVDEDGGEDDDLIFLSAKRVRSLPSDQVEVLDISEDL